MSRMDAADVYLESVWEELEKIIDDQDRADASYNSYGMTSILESGKEGFSPKDVAEMIVNYDDMIGELDGQLRSEKDVGSL